MADVVKTIALKGFDPDGEPSIRVMSDGSLEIRFEFMPPSDVEDAQGLGPFAAFNRELSEAAGVPVLWEDRELFFVKQAPPGTLERIQTFIEGYRHST